MQETPTVEQVSGVGAGGLHSVLVAVASAVAAVLVDVSVGVAAGCEGAIAAAGLRCWVASSFLVLAGGVRVVSAGGLPPVCVRVCVKVGSKRIRHQIKN